MKDIFVIDVKTIPDVARAAQLKHLVGLPQQEVAEALYFEARQNTGVNTLPNCLQKVVALVVAFCGEQGFGLRAFGETECDEKALLSSVCKYLSHPDAHLVTWCPKALSLLKIRSMVNRVAFAVDDYQPHWAAFMQSDSKGCPDQTLDQVSALLGYQFNLPVIGSLEIWQAWCEQQSNRIVESAKLSAIKAFLIYLRYQYMNGKVNDAELQRIETSVRSFITKQWLCPIVQFLDA